MVISCVAIGILQSLSVNLEGTLNSGQLRCQRTPARGRVSEAALMHHLRKYFFLFMEKQQESRKTQIIKQQQEESGICWDSLASEWYKLFTHKIIYTIKKFNSKLCISKIRKVIYNNMITGFTNKYNYISQILLAYIIF